MVVVDISHFPVWFGSTLASRMCHLSLNPATNPQNSERVYVSQQRVSCQACQRKGLTSGEVRGNFQGTSREVWGTSEEPLDRLKLHSERSSGEVTEKLPGKFGELPGEVRGLSRSPGEPDSLPATRQICLQRTARNSRSTWSIAFSGRSAMTRGRQLPYWMFACLQWISSFFSSLTA